MIDFKFDGPISENGDDLIGKIVVHGDSGGEIEDDLILIDVILLGLADIVDGIRQYPEVEVDLVDYPRPISAKKMEGKQVHVLYEGHQTVFSSEGKLRVDLLEIVKRFFLSVPQEALLRLSTYERLHFWLKENEITSIT